MQFQSMKEGLSTFSRFDEEIRVLLLLMSCDCKCFVALPHSVVGWYAGVVVVFTDHTHLLFDGGHITIFDV